MNEPNPYQAPPPVATLAEPIPAQQIQKTAGVNGDQLVVTHNAVLPKVCFKTGQAATETLVKKFTWVPPWLFLTILASPIIYIILFYIMRKQMTVTLPMSQQYASKRKRNITIANTLLVVFLIVTIAGIYLSVTDRRINDTMSAIYVGSIFVGFIAMLISAIAASVAGVTLKPTKIDDQWGWFNGAHPEFLRHLQ